jgi:LPS-assembly protein
VRVILVLWLVCVSLVSPAAAQQVVAPKSLADVVREQFESMQGLIEVVDENHIRFTRRVDMPVPGQTGSRMNADMVDLYFDQGVIMATGNVAFTSTEGRITAERVEFKFTEGTATFYVANGILTLPMANRAEFGNQDPDVYFYGEKIEKLGPKRYVITRGGFSTCVQPTPRWEISSNSIKLNLDDYALAKGMVLRVKGVPLMYLPAIYYPLHEDQRSTGFLMPTYGTSTLRGASLSNGFFWAIGRSQDATFFHDWFTRTGTGEGAEYRYVSGVGSSGMIRFYRFNQDETLFEQAAATTTLPAKTTYQLNGALTQQVGPFRAQGNVEYFTDVETQQLYQQNAYQRSQSRRTVSGGATGVFGPATVSGYFSQSEQFSDTQNSVIYGYLPRGSVNIAPSRLAGVPVYYSMNSEYVFQPNRTLKDGIVTADQSLARWDLAPAVRVPLSRLSFLSVTSNASYRRTYFSKSLDEAKSLVGKSITRQFMSLQTDAVGPVFAKIWDTPGSTYSERMKHVIEPTFSVEYITEMANQTRVPATDASVVAVGGAMKFTYGLTNRLLARAPAKGDLRGTTREFLTIGVQQTYYSDPETSRYDSTYASYTGRPRPVDLSPVAFIARVSPTPTIDANARVEYDVSGNGLQVVTAGSTIAMGLKSANITFSRQRFTPTSPVSSYLSGSTTMKFVDGRMTAFYGLNWDIDANYVFSQSLGAQYLAQCCGLQADYQVVNFPPSLHSPIPQDRRLNFAFVLAGLGTFSNFFGLFGGQP